MTAAYFENIVNPEQLYQYRKCICSTNLACLYRLVIRHYTPHHILSKILSWQGNQWQQELEQWIEREHYQTILNPISPGGIIHLYFDVSMAG